MLFRSFPLNRLAFENLATDDTWKRGSVVPIVKNTLHNEVTILAMDPVGQTGRLDAFTTSSRLKSAQGLAFRTAVTIIENLGHIRDSDLPHRTREGTLPEKCLSFLYGQCSTWSCTCRDTRAHVVLELENTQSLYSFTREGPSSV